MPSNQQKLDDIHWQTTDEGRDFVSRRALSEVKYPNAWGDQFSILTIINGIERRQAENNAQIAALTALVAETAKNPDITPDMVKQALKDAIGPFTITLTTDGGN